MASDLVLEWNATALAAVRAERISPPLAARNLAIVHAAIYDAVNAIDRTHEVYAVNVLAVPTTSREAAVATAAHRALVSLFPAQRTGLDEKYQFDLAAIPDGQAEQLGIALGDDVASQILALRASDGADTIVPYSPGTHPGQWQPTAPAMAGALLPNWPNVKPFAMLDGSQFTPHDIPALTSSEYAAAFNEVKLLGSATSSARTVDQTAMALFWANGAGTSTPPGHLNMMARIVAEAEGNTLSQNARLFAQLNVALADAAIMAWDAKYADNFWRPITAIRAADIDGNPNTSADAAWAPLIATPPFPAYVSGHASFSGAAEAVLAAFFGRDNVAFVVPSENPAVAARAFTSFSQAAEESADSRLYGGIHWRFDNEDGLRAGQRIGQYVAAQFFRPETRTAAAGLVGSVLVIAGSDTSDVLTVDLVRDQLVVRRTGRTLTTVPAGAAASIVVSAGAGNDIVDLGRDIRITATIFGGAGNDTLVGGRARDELYGEAGHDFLFGLDGADLLNGGDGNDLLFGGVGADQLFGGRGKNRLFQ